MTAEAAATATAAAISELPSHFMLDPGLYARGAELGLEGIDLYVAGRGGALGDVHGDVVAAGFVFWDVDLVREAWDRARKVMPPSEAAGHFIGAGHDWADAHLEADVDLGRLNDLLGRMTEAASPAAAPLFAAWRAMPEPGADRPRALALHRLNLLRELRGALHGGALLAHGVLPQVAVSIRAPYMLGIYGYDGPHPDATEPAAQTRWAAAEAATDVAMGAAYEVLDEAERVELRTLLTELHAPFAS